MKLFGRGPQGCAYSSSKQRKVNKRRLRLAVAPPQNPAEAQWRKMGRGICWLQVPVKRARRVQQILRTRGFWELEGGKQNAWQVFLGNAVQI
jgi:hypothetical protein